MGKVTAIVETKKDEPRLPDFLQREETAAQIVAVMRSKFSRPSQQEMLNILDCAKYQVIGIDTNTQ